MKYFGELTNAFWRVDQNLASWSFGDLEFGELVFWRVDYNPSDRTIIKIN